jgi:predicted O-methyltransferase YrrM
MLTERELAVARAAKGFMPDDEGLALHDAGLDGGRVGPLLEIGSYCGKSGVYLGAAARERETLLFTIDHHHGSEENQAGWEHHDLEVVDSRTLRMDTLPFFRRTIEDAGLESVVVGILGDSPTVGRFWASSVGFLFIDGGHAEDVAMADYVTWAHHVVPDGVLAIHDVFEDPSLGGQAPFHVWERAVDDGFTPIRTTGSLRSLRR